MQNKLHWAIVGQIAAEVVKSRADASKPNMRVTSWRGDKVRKTDVTIAKNYYDEAELAALNNLVEQYLILAEGQAQRRIPMKMVDWITKLDAFLMLNDREVLKDAGRVTQQLAQGYAAEEYLKYRQNILDSAESDFDRFSKRMLGEQESPEGSEGGQGGSGAIEIDTAIGQLVNEAVTADEVLDIFEIAGTEKPELSIVSDDFLDSLAHKEKPNLQMGLLRRMLNDQIVTVRLTNFVQARKFSELLDSAVNRYTNRSLTTAEIITELVDLAKDMRDQQKRHEQLGLSFAEAAFYDALAQNESAVFEMGDETLKQMTVALVQSVRKSATIDWSIRESVRAKMRTKVRRLLAKYDYPPDLEEKAVELVLEQAELYAVYAANGEVA